MKQAVQVTILGQQFTLRSEASPDEALRVAAFVNEQIEEVRAHSAADSLRTVLLALLNVSGTYLKLRDSGACFSDEAERRLGELAKQLEEANGISAGEEPGLFDT